MNRLFLLVCGITVLTLNATPGFAGRGRAYVQHQPYVAQSAAIAQIPAPAPAPVATSVGVSCCDHDPSIPCTPECKKGKNDPVVTSKCPPGSEDCKPIPIEVVPGIEKIETDEKFYVKCDNYEAKVPVPVLEVKKTERCEFKKYTYSVDCCEITVCVPCKRCVTESKKCVTKISDKPQKIRICERRDGTVDVYVLDVPGMPKQWLLYMEASLATVKAELGL